MTVRFRSSCFLALDIFTKSFGENCNGPVTVTDAIKNSFPSCTDILSRSRHLLPSIFVSQMLKHDLFSREGGGHVLLNLNFSALTWGYFHAVSIFISRVSAVLTFLENLDGSVLHGCIVSNGITV